MARRRTRRAPVRAPKGRGEDSPQIEAQDLASNRTGAPAERKNMKKEVKKLIDLGKEKGYLTYDDVNDMLQPKWCLPIKLTMSCPFLGRWTSKWWIPISV